MNEFYKAISELKADETYIKALERRAKTHNPSKPLAKTEYYVKLFCPYLFEWNDMLGIIREIILGGRENWGAWNSNGFAFENDLSLLIANKLTKNDIKKAEKIYNAWRYKTVDYEYSSNANEWREVAAALS